MSDEDRLRDELVTLGRSLYDRGLAHGSAGNLSVKLSDGWLMSPTNSCLGRLDPACLSRLDAHGRLVERRNRRQSAELRRHNR